MLFATSTSDMNGLVIWFIMFLTHVQFFYENYIAPPIRQWRQILYGNSISRIRRVDLDSGEVTELYKTNFLIHLMNVTTHLFYEHDTAMAMSKNLQVHSLKLEECEKMNYVYEIITWDSKRYLTQKDYDTSLVAVAVKDIQSKNTRRKYLHATSIADKTDITSHVNAYVSSFQMDFIKGGSLTTFQFVQILTALNYIPKKMRTPPLTANEECVCLISDDNLDVKTFRALDPIVL